MSTTFSNEQLHLNPLLIAPHSSLSHPVTSADLPRVDREGKKMFLSLKRPHGIHRMGITMSHAQITSSDPLQFFVMFSGDVICNVKIIRAVKTPKMVKEGCLTFPFIKEKIVQRFYKMTVEYQTVFEGEKGELQLSEVMTRELKNFEAFIWQHEIDHFNCKYI